MSPLPWVSPVYPDRTLGHYFLTLVGVGAAYGTAKSGAAIASMGVVNPNSVMSSLIPVIMAGVLSIYGLVVSVFISTSSKDRQYIMTDHGLNTNS